MTRWSLLSARVGFCETDGPACEAGGIEIDVSVDGLGVQQRPQMIPGVRIRARDAASNDRQRLRVRARAQGFCQNPAGELAGGMEREAQDVSDGHTDVGVARWQRIDEGGTEVRTTRRHEVP